MNTELRSLLRRIALTGVSTATMAVFFSAALGLVDGNFLDGFGYRFRITAAFLMLVSLPIGLAWPRQSTTLKQNALRTLLELCVLSAVDGACFYWLLQSANRAWPFACLGLALYGGVRLAGIELTATSTWSALRRRLTLGLLTAIAVGALAGFIGKFLLLDPPGLLAMIAGGVAFTVCAIFPGFVGKWMMDVAYREVESPSGSGTNGIGEGKPEKSNVPHASEDRTLLLRLAGRRALRRGCIVGGALVPVLPALAGALTMNVKYAVLIAITGHLCYWGEFWSCYWDWRRRL